MSASLQQAPPSGYTNPGPRSLHFYYDSSFTKRRMIITDSDKATNLYAVSHRSSWSVLFSSKPDMSIVRVSDNSEIGAVTLHSFSPTELIIHGRIVFLEHVDWLSRGRTFQSAATGTTLTWQYDSALGDSVTCSNETNQWLARFSPSSFSLSKGGVLELASPAVDGILLDEIIVTALAIMQERKRRQHSSSSASGANGL